MAVSQRILTRLQEKKADYTRYGFSRVESNALKTYFDLAQEFDDIRDVYQVSVGIPKCFFDLEARLYVMDPERGGLGFVAGTENGSEASTWQYPGDTGRPRQAYCVGDCLILPIRGKKQLISQLPFRPVGDLIGVLEVYPCDGSDAHRVLFFEKYANRIGFSLHMRFLLQKNVEHVEFVRRLVADIEHNVIVPNMVNKLFLRRLEGKIKKSREIQEALDDRIRSAAGQGSAEAVADLLVEFKEVNRGFSESLDNIKKQYASSSLFLETLLRKSHFDEGRLTLRTKSCHMKRDVIVPQLERFSERFARRGTQVLDAFEGPSDEESVAVVDVGLMAQVYSNFFSNALKYTREVTTADGSVKKVVSFGRKKLKDYFGPGKHGTRYDVFSTGPHIPEPERKHLFEEGYRGSGSLKRPGTGHGLAFIKNAVEIHGGMAGYEAVADGNTFYFILPD